MFFVFDDLTSWKRVVVWKNRKSDGGAYIFNGRLNFYPIIFSGIASITDKRKKTTTQLTKTNLKK
jgi:hypothetical protein